MSFTSITQRFLVWFLIISLLPILLIGYSLLHTFEKELQQTIARQIAIIADKKLDQIDYYLSDRAQDAMVKTHGNSTRRAMIEFTQAFARGGVESDAYRQLDAANHDYFKRFVISSGYHDMFLISPQGVVVYSYARETDFATNLLTGPYRNSGLAKVTRNVLDTLESSISDFEFYAPSGNAIAAFIAVPIMVQGKLEGVLALQQDSVRVFQVLADDTGLGISGETVVVRLEDENTALVMAPLKTEPDAALKRKIKFSTSSPPTATQNSLHGLRGGGVTIDYRGVPVVAAWRYLPRMGWGMAVKMDADEAFAPAYRMRNYALIILGLTIVLSTLSAFLLGRRIVIPLKKLSHSVQNFADGKLDQRVSVVGEDELGQLAVSFNDMAEHLQSSYAGLEQRVEQRTSDLRFALKQGDEAQKALQISAARLNDAQRVAKVGSWELNLLTGKLLWTDEIFRLFEIDKNKFGATYEAFLNAIHPDDRDSANQAYTDSLENRRPYEITHRLRMRDGRIKWVQERCSSDFDGEGKPILSIGTVQDITEHKRVEQALEQSELLYRTLAQVAPVGIFHTDSSGGCTYVNEQYCEISGRSREAALGVGWSAAIHPDDRTRVFDEWEHSVKNQEPFKSEFRFLHPTGQVTWVTARSRAEMNSHGEVLGYVGTITDITERKYAEAELKQLNEELEQRVLQRTVLLLRAKEEAELANNAKSEFLSRMSHELRTPMNAVLGFAQLLETDEETPLTPDQVDNVREIRHAGRHLLELINEVLDLARIETGRIELSMEPVELSALIGECIALLRPLASVRQIELSLDGDDSSTVQADRLRLRQILLNLLSNAVKYNRDKGNVRISCRLVAEGRVRIAVCDSGRGIAADALPRLFKPFERIESAYDGIDGAGIGLALTKYLVEAMDGTIGVESVAGEGSTFWVEFPAAEAKVYLPVDLIASDAMQNTYVTAKTVLYIEDNPANLRLVQRIISTQTCLLLLDARTAEQGLDIAKAQHPDLILLDINLPGMNGFEALRQLQDDPVTCGIPVIAISANAMERDVKKGLAAGFVDYLTKPLDIPKLLTLLDAILK